jgi:hypothetical protein
MGVGFSETDEGRQIRPAVAKKFKIDGFHDQTIIEKT